MMRSHTEENGSNTHMHSVTTLRLDERVERILAYLPGWMATLIPFLLEKSLFAALCVALLPPAWGFVLFRIERNRNVRWHAVQSTLLFGLLSLLTLGVSLLKGILGWIPFLSLLTNFGLGLLLNALWWTTLLLWIWLLGMAWTQTLYRLPIVSMWIRYFA